MIKSIVILVGLFIIFFMLYMNGWMIINKKRATLFMGSLYGSNHWKLQFVDCNGSIKRKIKFNEGHYTFVLDKKLSKGDVYVDLIDKKHHVIRIDENINLILEKGCYTMVYYFKDATGRIGLLWK